MAYATNFIDYNIQSAINISLEPVSTASIPTDILASLPVEYSIHTLSMKEFAMSREGFQTLVKPLVIAGIIFLAPGLGIVIIKGVPASSMGLFKTAQLIVKESANYFYSCFVPQSWTVQAITCAGINTVSAMFLFQKLVVSSYSESYATWKIARTETILNNLMIPKEFHNDPILNKYICPITFSPIKFPVKDRYGRYWEQPAICAWLTNNSTCPMTRQPLNVSDLVFDREVYQEITDRLKELGWNN